MSTRAPIHNDKRCDPPLPWSRRTPRRKPAEVRAVKLTEDDLKAPFYARGEYRWTWPAAKKARRVIENRGLRVSDADERAMRKHREKSRRNDWTRWDRQL